jgi:hypothetical protein
METKGICSLCGNTVFGHQERGKDQKGSYFHMSCVGVSAAGTHVPHSVAPVAAAAGNAAAHRVPGPVQPQPQYQPQYQPQPQPQPQYHRQNTGVSPAKPAQAQLDHLVELGQEQLRMAAGGQTAELYKTKMCKNWQDGTCTYGNRCNFAHGKEDLRSGGGQLNRPPPRPVAPYTPVIPSTPAAVVPKLCGSCFACSYRTKKPYTPCKDGLRCPRKDCWFAHACPASMTDKASACPSACNDGIGCTKSTCRFAHPSKSLVCTNPVEISDDEVSLVEYIVKKLQETSTGILPASQLGADINRRAAWAAEIRQAHKGKLKLFCLNHPDKLKWINSGTGQAGRPCFSFHVTPSPPPPRLRFAALLLHWARPSASVLARATACRRSRRVRPVHQARSASS